MKPYYEHGGIAIYHGDCREILHALPLVDLVLTDPPYGLGDRWTGGTWGAAPEYKEARQWDVKVDDDLLRDVIARGSDAIVWGGNHYALPPCRGFLAWTKLNAVPTMADLEIAWTTFDRPAKAWSSGVNPDGKHLHPTAKPLALMAWCLVQARLPPTAVVFDPFAGSGTSLRAAKDSGLRAIGIEISERYCEIAARRLGQGVLFGNERNAA